ncbi:MAG TPA: protein kinase [Candidatus Saccharimonadales bacterium]|nr:protein kinase [Candidatus Saccharimonadales bacterium]
MIESRSALTVRQVIPDYELLRRIGAGAYGEVWLARSKATGVLRAAKIVWREKFADERPFQREFEGIRRFERISREHSSQLALFHIGRNDAEGLFYYVMELADNLGTDANYVARTLRADLENGRLPAERVLEIGLALAEALRHLHGNGLVHRDVKPSNVIFVNARPKLADIGLVTDASDKCSIVGTEGYLPPEGPGTPQADIYALGKVLYESATGLDRRKFPELPFDLPSWPDAGQVFELNEIILKGCESDGRRRYRACEEMQDDLELLRRGKSVKQRRTREQRWAVEKKALAMVTVVVVLTASAAFLRWQMSAMTPLKTDSAQYHTADSMTKFNDWKFEEAINEAALAIKLDPRIMRAHGYYGWYLELAHDDTEAAKREYKIAEQLDPGDAIIQMVMSEPFMMEHKFDLAIKQLKKALRLNPQSAEIHERLSMAYDADQQYDKAIDEHVQGALLNSTARDFMNEWEHTMRSILHEKGPRGLWQAELNWQKQHFIFDPYWMATINARLGETNEVFSLLDQACKEHNRGMINLLVDDHWDGYRSDPRFKELLTKVGFHPIPGPVR